MRAEGHEPLSTTSKPGSPSYSLSHSSLNMTFHDAGVTSFCHTQRRGSKRQETWETCPGSQGPAFLVSTAPAPSSTGSSSTGTATQAPSTSMCLHIVQTVTQYYMMGLWLKLSWPCPCGLPACTRPTVCRARCPRLSLYVPTLILESAISPRIPGSFHWRTELEINTEELGMLTALGALLPPGLR